MQAEFECRWSLHLVLLNVLKLSLIRILHYYLQYNIKEHYDIHISSTLEDASKICIRAQPRKIIYSIQ